MSVESFDTLSVLTIFICTAVFIFVSFEFGYQIGKYIRTHGEIKADTSQGPMVGGVLAMLAFVLAFTFSMAASRLDTRKQGVLEEVNAINSAYLLAELLAQPHRAEMKRLLSEYVNTRLLAIEQNDLEMAIAKSLELHKLLWAQVTVIEKQIPTVSTILFIQSINKIINVHEKRVNAAVRDRIPDSIWLTLMLITAFTMVTTGSQTGLIKTRRLIQVIPTVLAFSALITLVVDLDRPSELGQIKVSQEAMIDLQKKMNQARQ